MRSVQFAANGQAQPQVVGWRQPGCHSVLSLPRHQHPLGQAHGQGEGKRQRGDHADADKHGVGGQEVRQADEWDSIFPVACRGYWGAVLRLQKCQRQAGNDGMTN